MKSLKLVAVSLALTVALATDLCIGLPVFTLPVAASIFAP